MECFFLYLLVRLKMKIMRCFTAVVKNALIKDGLAHLLLYMADIP